MTFDQILAQQKLQRRKPTHQEDNLQKACTYWFDTQYPHLAQLLHHSPNEGKLWRGAIDGAKRKAMGTRAGFPDFILLMPNTKYHYLAIELKTKTGRQTPTQKHYEQLIKQQDGLYVICRSLEEFIHTISNYLKPNNKA